LILKLWNWILGFGLSDSHPDEHELIKMQNGMSLVTVFGAFSVALHSWIIGFPTIYTAFSSGIGIFYLFIIFSNFINKPNLARLLLTIGTPIWISGLHICVGGNFSQSVALITALAINYIFIRNTRLKYIIFFANLVLYFGAFLYVQQYQPIYGVIDFPYDEIVVFLGGLGWILTLFYKFSKDKEKLVNDLKDKNSELQLATEELERFTYIASHDLKSPLRSIISFIGLIERDVKRGEYVDIQEKLGFVKTGAEQMNFLVRDILEFSKLRSDQKIEHTLIDLNLVYRKAIHNLKEDIKDKNAILHCDDLPSFLGSELEFLILFQNFIQNGIKYNENPKPTIHILSVKTDQALQLIFKDNGIGIKEEYHEQIFQFFKRLHNSSQYQGTGLGLGLCKKIITNYNGSVDIDSIVGKGTTFRIIFPTVEKQIDIKHTQKELRT